jgi:hypothetical protein
MGRERVCVFDFVGSLERGEAEKRRREWCNKLKKKRGF